MTGLIYAQDKGTGLDSETEATWADAASLMAAVHDSNTTQYIVNNPPVATDFANDQVTVGPVQANVELSDITTEDHIGSGGQQIAQKTWPEATVTVLVDQQTVSVAATGTTDIYASVDVEATDPNQVSLVTSQPATGMLVATVDADAETVTKQNLRPDGEFAALEAQFATHATELNEDYTVPAGKGAVVAGPITGSGSISGDGKLAVLQEGTQLSGDLDAKGFDITNISNLEANTLLGADVANASENQILVVQDDGTLSAETQAQGPNPYDQAQSFAESNVSLALNKTEVNNGGIRLSDSANGETLVIDAGGLLGGGQRGVVINPNTDLIGVSFTVARPFPDPTINLLDSNQNVISSKTPGSLNRNEEITFIENLSNNADYIIEIDDSESASAGISLPLAGAELDVVDGWEDGTTSSTLYNINEITPLLEAKSGTAIIEWDRGIPTDIFEWDVATFTRTLDGETVDVYVAYSSDGGSTWTRTNSGNPISRNYSLNEDLNISYATDVRIEAELSRSDTAKNPTLDSCYRSWLV